MKVSVIGTGYVGLNTAVALAYCGHKVIGIDVDTNKVEKLNNGIPVISEEGLPELLNKLSGSDNLSFTNKYDVIVESDVVFITVGTPSNKDGSANLSYIFSVVNSIIEVLNSNELNHDLTIVVKSTVPFGVNEQIQRIIRDAVSCSTNSHLLFASNPEFLREGTALYDTFYPDRIIIGSCDKSSEVLTEMYKPILNREFVRPSFISEKSVSKSLPQLLITDQVSAEMIKYASNCFLALKISYTNEIEKLAEKVGANIKDISKGMGMDKRIAPYFLNSGLGWGGSCFPKDTLAIMAIAKEYNMEMPIVRSAVEVNNSQINRVIQKTMNELHTLHGKKIAVFGITFKPNTDDVRNSLAVELCYKLKSLGAAIYITDPCGLENAKEIYSDSGFNFIESPYDAAKDADAVIIATDWNDYKSIDYAKIKESMKLPVMIDTRNILFNSESRHLFTYHHM